ncbi:hypothetical protein NP493_48g07064 [Ridgeia piscesae]|uniref:Fibronectin type-III domain-containing protein n=1 Tax=Ridgeia piscesae TaxID=27915 RepID=A0AAD9UJC2_RIDPI|nr:hypothetical protein NP493_48g07064 [Ridgeia piscesae]
MLSFPVTGARCRFASRAHNQGSCIFPCRCTQGCDIATGNCLNSGKCIRDHPDNFQWSGKACQTGNVAYNKKASQSGEKTNIYSRSYPASRAVDGNTDSYLKHDHCAHPMLNDTTTTAWWKVDLNGTYRLYSVVIYNRNSNIERLDGFTLSVGSSSQSDRLVQCGTHTGRVASSASVTTSCEAVGRYLEFRRTRTTFQSHKTGLCEVVIIGHRYITCQHCPSSSRCGDVTGCDACEPGKQQPDCKKRCDDKTYGVNCETPCGHCKDSSPCDVVNGRCSNGCEDWYSLDDICKTFIPIPRFDTSARPTVDVINSSAVVVSWSKATNIPSALEDHYYYVVWLQVDGGTKVKATQIQHDVHSNRFESYITGLVYNTHYSVWVEAFRQQDKKHEGGSHTVDAIFKTDCIGRVTVVCYVRFRDNLHHISILHV